MSGEWAKSQIARVHGPVYAARAKKARDAKFRARYERPLVDGWRRRDMRRDAMAVTRWKRFGEDPTWW